MASRRGIVAAAFVFGFEMTPAAAFAKTHSGIVPAGATISVLTIGPGESLLTRFGHTAVRVRDVARDVDLVYDFGSFPYEPDTVIGDALFGRLDYQLLSSPFAPTLERYRRQGRSVVEQTLNLSAPEAMSLRAILARGLQPEQRHYRYDYLRNNCTTRVRDAIDQALSGRFRAGFRGADPDTHRHDLLRVVSQDLAISVLLDLSLNADVDARRTRWASMFLPENLEQHLAAARLDDGPTTRVLVKRTEVLVSAAPIRSAAWDRARRSLGVWGLLAGVSIAAAGVRAAQVGRKRWRRRLLLALAGLGLASGLAGAWLLFLWLATPQTIAAANQNLFQFSPFALLFGVAAALAAFDSRRIQGARYTAYACLVASLAGVIIPVAAGVRQGNAPFVGLMLPIWLASVLALERVRRAGGGVA